VRNLGPDYFGVIPITDVPGFAVRRRYPENTALAKIVNRQGDQVVTPIIQFMVQPTSPPGGVSAVMLRAWVFPRSASQLRQLRALVASRGDVIPDGAEFVDEGVSNQTVLVRMTRITRGSSAG